MSFPSPVNLARFQTGLCAVLDEATGASSAFAYGEGVYNSTFGANYINLTLTGPAPKATTAARAFTFLPCESVTFTVTEAIEGQLIGLYVNEMPIRHTVTGADTPETIRDTLVTAIAEAAPEWFTADDGGAVDEFTLSPVFFGGIWSASKFGSLTAVVTLEDDLAAATMASRGYSVQIEAFSTGRDPSTGAWALVDKITAALELPENALTFRDYGFGIGQIGIGVDLSAISGGYWNTRVAFDLDVNLQSVVVRPVDRITSVTGAAAFTVPSISSTIEAST